MVTCPVFRLAETTNYKFRPHFRPLPNTTALDPISGPTKSIHTFAVLAASRAARCRSCQGKLRGVANGFS